MNNSLNAMQEIAVLDKFLEGNEVETFVESLRKHPKTTVVLRGNCLGATGAEVIGKYLKEEKCELISLSLEWNQLGSAGCAVLAEALQMNTSITHLDLRNNNIKNDGVISLAKALEVNHSLRSLDMRWNHITDGSVFKDSLLSRSPPLRLQISGNHLPESSSVMIQNWIAGDDIEAEVSTDISTGFDSENTNNNALPAGGGGKGKPSMNFARSQGMLDATNTRLQKESAALRRQCAATQEEVTSLNRQLELSAVQVTQLEQTVLKEQYAKSQIEEALRASDARVTIQLEERQRLVDSWQAERESLLGECRAQLAKRDAEISTICMERDRAVQDCRIAKEHSEKLEVQLGDQGRQGNQERGSLQLELNTLREQLSEVTLSEDKLHSEVSMLKKRAERAEEQVSQLEEENIKSRRNLEQSHSEAMQEKDAQQDRNRAEWHDRVNSANDKLSAQSAEIQGLYKKISDLEAQLSTIKADLELQNEKAIAQIRADESKRTEGTISDLKNKVDMFVASREDLEKQNKQYLTELTESQDRHKATSQKITMQLNAAEAELVRLRQQNATLREESSTLLAASNTNSAQINNLTQKSQLLEELNSDLKSKLASAQLEVSSVEERTRALQISTAKHDAQRSVEFFTIKNSLLKVFQREFDALQSTLEVQSPKTDVSNPEVSTTTTTAAASSPKVVSIGEPSQRQQQAKPAVQSPQPSSYLAGTVGDETDESNDFSVESGSSSSSSSSGEGEDI